MSRKRNSRFDLPAVRFLWQREQDKGFPGRSVPKWRAFSGTDGWMPPLDAWRGDLFGNYPKLF